MERAFAFSKLTIIFIIFLFNLTFVLNCHYCQSEASIYVKYAKMHLCKEHFISFIDKKIESTLKRYDMVRKDSRILIAISGGKDSAVMLNSLSKIGLNLLPVYIDLGIDNYSIEAKKVCEKLVSMLGMKLINISLKDLIGMELTELAKRARRPYCSVCGTVKRYLLNITALCTKTEKIAMGHHLDDLITLIFKSLLTQRLEDIAKLGPKTESIEGLIGRIRPLYEVSENENSLYAEFSNLPFLSSKCPYAYRGELEAMIKDFINRLEENFPGIKVSIARYIAKNVNKFKSEMKWMNCKSCNLPSSSEYCSFCRIIKKATGEIDGSIIKEKIIDMLS